MIEQVFDFTPLSSFEQWLSTYRKGIRVQVDWDLLCKGRTKPRLHQFQYSHPKDGGLCLPWYDGGSWRTGRRKKIAVCLDGHHVVRAPGVFCGKDIMLLDGCHRATQLKPMLIIVDAIEPRNIEQRAAFNDLLGIGGDS